MVACRRSETSCGCARVDKYARICECVSAFSEDQGQSKVPRLSIGSQQRPGSVFLAPRSPSTEHKARIATPSPAL